MDNKIVFVFVFLLLFIGNIRRTFYKFMILLPRSSFVSSSNLKIYYKKNSNEYITPLRLYIYILLKFQPTLSYGCMKLNEDWQFMITCSAFSRREMLFVLSSTPTQDPVNYACVLLFNEFSWMIMNHEQGKNRGICLSCEWEAQSTPTLDFTWQEECVKPGKLTHTGDQLGEPPRRKDAVLPPRFLICSSNLQNNAPSCLVLLVCFSLLLLHWSGSFVHALLIWIC